MFDGSDGFPFVIGGSMTSVTDLHPPAVQILQLWQIYLDNVNPLLKLTHTPTLQGQLIEAAANPSKVSRPLEALLFSIYYIAVLSLTEEEAQDTFKEEKTRMMSRFHRATQQALINAGFMRSPDLAVLQAFLMYLVSIPQALSPSFYLDSSRCLRRGILDHFLFLILCLIPSYFVHIWAVGLLPFSSSSASSSFSFFPWGKKKTIKETQYLFFVFPF